MNDDAYSTDCDTLLDYLSDACTEKEKEAFKRHLTHCHSCRQELAEWQTVWEELPLDMERIEPPQDLKEQIMAAAKSSPRRRQSLKLRELWKPVAAVAAAAILFFAGSLWDNPLLKNQDNQLPSIENALHAKASRIVQLSMLKAESGEKEHAYGVACIVDNGQSKQFVVYVFGANETKNDEAYQVWLVKDGSRTSAGTFHVDDKGVGLLAMAIGPSELSFDRIGITLEPDGNGVQPRGKKAFGSESAPYPFSSLQL